MISQKRKKETNLEKLGEYPCGEKGCAFVAKTPGGLGSHRLKHGVPGTSPGSLAHRKKTKKVTNVAYAEKKKGRPKKEKIIGNLTFEDALKYVATKRDSYVEIYNDLLKIRSLVG